MPVEVILPKVDMDMESAIIESWKVSEGQIVAKGDILFEIITNKAAMEVDAPASGTIGAISGPIGEPIPVGAVVAMIFRDGESRVDYVAPTRAPVAAAMQAAAPAAIANQNAAPAHVNEAKGVRATPLARKTARAFNINLETVTGAGPRGRISAEDVRAAAMRAPLQRSAERPGRLIPFDPVQRIAAMRLAASMHAAPHFYLTADIDMSALVAARANAAGVRASLTVLIARIVARVLKQHPRLNASVEDQAMRLHDRVDIAIAFDREGSLIAPVLRNVDQRGVDELNAEFDGLKTQAQDRTIKSADLTGGTFTISNLGMFGVDSFTAIINPPQSAILAIGRTQDRPVGRNGEIVLRPIATFSLSSDHRIVDGVAAARFMADLRAAIEGYDAAA